MYSALGAEEFPRRDNFATRTERKTHERYGKDASIDRETIAKLSQNSLTHADKARPSTTITLYELYVLIHRRLLTDGHTVYIAFVCIGAEGRGWGIGGISRFVRIWAQISNGHNSKAVRDSPVNIFSGRREQENLMEQLPWT